MDVSWGLSLLLGLPVAVLALLKIIDWCKKRAAAGEQHIMGSNTGETV